MAISNKQKTENEDPKKGGSYIRSKDGSLIENKPAPQKVKDSEPIEEIKKD